MIDDRKDAVDSTESGFEFWPAVHFDDTANANAKPVEPIPDRGIAGFIQHARYVQQMLASRTKVFALALVGGLAIGALGHTVLVREDRSLPDAAAVQQPNPELATIQEAPADATLDQGLNDETQATQVSTLALQGARQSASGNRHRTTRREVQRGPRAYRIAVIR